MSKLTPERFLGDGKTVPDKRRAIDLVIDTLFERIKRDAELERVYLSLSYSDPDVRRLRAQYEEDGCAALTRLNFAGMPIGHLPQGESASAARATAWRR